MLSMRTIRKAGPLCIVIPTRAIRWAVPQHLRCRRFFREQHILEQAARNADWLTGEMKTAFGDHPNVGEIRHIGLIQAIELVADPATKEPLEARQRIGYAIYKRALEYGLV